VRRARRLRTLLKPLMVRHLRLHLAQPTLDHSSRGDGLPKPVPSIQVQGNAPGGYPELWRPLATPTLNRDKVQQAREPAGA